MISSFHIVTHSYSSCLFLCALAGTMVLFVSKPITFYEVVQLLYEITVLNYLFGGWSILYDISQLMKI